MKNLGDEEDADEAESPTESQEQQDEAWTLIIAEATNQRRRRKERKSWDGKPTEGDTQQTSTTIEHDKPGSSHQPKTNRNRQRGRGRSKSKHTCYLPFKI